MWLPDHESSSVVGSAMRKSVPRFLPHLLEHHAKPRPSSPASRLEFLGLNPLCILLPDSPLPSLCAFQTHISIHLFFQHFLTEHRHPLCHRTDKPNQTQPLS